MVCHDPDLNNQTMDFNVDKFNNSDVLILITL